MARGDGRVFKRGNKFWVAYYGFKQDNFQRSLDPDTFQLVFRGDNLDLRRLAEELHRLESAVQVWLRTHNPW